MLKEIKIFPVKNPQGKTLAFVSCNFHGLVLTGLKIIEGNEGKPFIGMPSTKGKDDQWRDIFFPVTKELRAELTEAILAEYQGSNQSIPDTPSLQEPEQPGYDPIDDDMPF